MGEYIKYLEFWQTPAFESQNTAGDPLHLRGILDNKPVAQKNPLSGQSGRLVVWSGGHLQARRARLQARRANEEAPCIFLPRHVAPNSRPVAPA